MATEYTVRAPKSFAKAWQVARNQHPELRKIFESGIIKFGPFRLAPGGQVTIVGSVFVRYAALLDKAIDAGLLELVASKDVDGPEVVTEVEPVTEPITETEVVTEEPVTEVEVAPEPEVALVPEVEEITEESQEPINVEPKTRKKRTRKGKN
jgi:hypothetical protein